MYCRHWPLLTAMREIVLAKKAVSLVNTFHINIF